MLRSPCPESSLPYDRVFPGFRLDGTLSRPHFSSTATKLVLLHSKHHCLHHPRQIPRMNSIVQEACATCSSNWQALFQDGNLVPSRRCPRSSMAPWQFHSPGYATLSFSDTLSFQNKVREIEFAHRFPDSLRPCHVLGRSGDQNRP
jgi:hypothetical protein